MYFLSILIVERIFVLLQIHRFFLAWSLSWCVNCIHGLCTSFFPIQLSCLQTLLLLRWVLVQQSLWVAVSIFIGRLSVFTHRTGWHWHVYNNKCRFSHSNQPWRHPLLPLPLPSLPSFPSLSFTPFPPNLQSPLTGTMLVQRRPFYVLHADSTIASMAPWSPSQVSWPHHCSTAAIIVHIITLHIQLQAIFPFPLQIRKIHRTSCLRTTMRQVYSSCIAWLLSYMYTHVHVHSYWLL